MKNIFKAEILIIVLLSQINLLAQNPIERQKLEYSELEGIYELKLPGTDPAQSEYWYGFYKNGAFILIDIEDGERNSFTSVDGQVLTFRKTFQQAGTFNLSFIEDDLEGRKQFRLQNDLAGMDVVVTKTGPIDDSKMDPGSPADRVCYFERHYTKDEYMIPMRDSVSLYTQVYTPMNPGSQNPVILFRTPYGVPPYGQEFSDRVFPSLWFAKEDYILVYQEIRGSFMSEGEFSYLSPYKINKERNDDIDESSDAYDTVEWLLKNISGNNGKVGVWGSSYPGFTATMAALSGHPAIVAVSSQAPMTDLFLGDDGHHYGALYLQHYINYLFRMDQLHGEEEVSNGVKGYKYPSPDSYSYFLGLGSLENITKTITGGNNYLWNQVMHHETYDEFWKNRSLNNYLPEVKPAMLTVGGWYDGEDLLGTLNTYKIIEGSSPGNENNLVMGPWKHSGWNLITGGSEKIGVFPFEGTVRHFQQNIELPFFNYHLKNKGDFDISEAIVYETGTEKWRTFSKWPPSDAVSKKLFISDSGKLSLSSETPESGNYFEEFVSDPNKPVPYTSTISTEYNKEYFVEDQRFASARPDVLVFCSDILTEDMTITGSVEVELFVSTSGTDADWVVKMIDVYPDNSKDPKPNPGKIRMGGYQRLIRGDIIRGKFRNSFEEPEPFQPWAVTPINFELPDVQHTFLKGHRIMIHIQSSWFPLFDRNPQKFCNIRLAGEEEFQKAVHRVYRSEQYPSGIVVKVIPPDQDR